MSKTTLIFMIFLQIMLPNKVIENPSDLIIEALLFLLMIILGSGAKIALRIRNKIHTSTSDILLLLSFSLVVGFIAEYAMIYYQMKVPRGLVIVVLSFLSEVIVVRIDKASPKLIDKAISKATGTDVENQPEEKEESEQPNP